MLKLKVGGTGRTDVDLESIKAARKGIDNNQACDQDACKMSLDDPKVTLCMIVKDEEAHLARCLNSVKGHVDEMVIVDTGSTDKTIEIAKSFGAKVYHHPWENSFSKARNQAMSYVTTEWMLQLDADEEIDAEDAPKIRDTIKSVHDSTANLCYLVLTNKSLKGDDTLSMVNSGKIIRNGVGAHYQNKVHNKLVIDGDSRLTGLRIYHYGYHLDKETQKKKADRTTKMLLEQLEEDKNDPDTYHYLGVQSIREGKWDDTILYSQKAIELYKEQQPDTQLILLDYQLSANAYYHKQDMKNCERCCLEALKVYPDYLDSVALLTSVYFVTKNYDKCYEYSLKYFAIAKMLNSDRTKSLVIPMNTLKNEWMINIQLAINFYEQAKEKEARFFVARSEDCLSDEKKYTASFTVFQYFFKRGDPASIQNAEVIYRNGFRKEAA